MGKSELVAGKILGKYQLRERIATGGSSEIWRARDTVEGIEVAMKIPLVDVSGRRDNGHLMKEVRLVSQLRHRNIMPVKNADIIDGHAVLVTELCTTTLDDRSRPMAASRIIPIMDQVLSALAYAHKKRIVHCDVTPANIFLFAGGRAALGDFGISQEVKGRRETIDEFGTSGYVAPEQAYGHPVYASDCFSVGLILYEFLTSSLLAYPFKWPGRGYARLVERTAVRFAAFMKKALDADPKRRFPNAAVMREAMRESAPARVRKRMKESVESTGDWKRIRNRSFRRKYERVFGRLYRCVECGEPVGEAMSVCPWCGSERNRFDARTSFPLVCGDCGKGVMPQWRYCPWCYGRGFAHPEPESTAKLPGRYVAACRYCGGRLMRFMRYCPHCHRKIGRDWRSPILSHPCHRCGWPVDSEYWRYCPWCGENAND